MGSAGRKRPEKLGLKLKAIRDHFNYSFTQMADRLSDKKVTILRTDVSRYEKGLREPPLSALLKYARLIGISTDILIDDETDLPYSI